MTDADVAVVVGNPRPQSRTLAAALHVATSLVGHKPTSVIDLANLGTDLLNPDCVRVKGLVADVGAADLVIVASPTYKGTYTGLLKLFLDRFAGGNGLRGLAVPLLLGGSPTHALAPEVTLRPVLTELGATVPGRGLFVLEHQYDDPGAYAAWLAATEPVVARYLRGPPA